MRQILLMYAFVFTVSAAAAPGELPARKSGLWQITMTSDEMPMSMTTLQCVDESGDNLLEEVAGEEVEQDCSEVSSRRDGNRYVTQSTCRIDDSTAITEGVFTGDFRENYHVQLDTIYTPPLEGMKSSRQILEAKWLGPCKPGQKPGDVIVPGISKMNLNDIMKDMAK